MMNTGQLKKKLQELEVSDEAYCLDGTFKPDRMVLMDNFSEWVVMYLDQEGTQNNVRRFPTERDACNYLYNYYRLK